MMTTLFAESPFSFDNTSSFEWPVHESKKRSHDEVFDLIDHYLFDVSDIHQPMKRARMNEFADELDYPERKNCVLKFCGFLNERFQ